MTDLGRSSYNSTASVYLKTTKATCLLITRPLKCADSSPRLSVSPCVCRCLDSSLPLFSSFFPFFHWIFLAESCYRCRVIELGVHTSFSPHNYTLGSGGAIKKFMVTSRRDWNETMYSTSALNFRSNLEKSHAIFTLSGCEAAAESLCSDRIISLLDPTSHSCLVSTWTLTWPAGLMTYG